MATHDDIPYADAPHYGSDHPTPEAPMVPLVTFRTANDAFSVWCALSAHIVSLYHATDGVEPGHIARVSELIEAVWGQYVELGGSLSHIDPHNPTDHVDRSRS